MKVAERIWVIFDRTLTVLMVLGAALVIFDVVAISVDVLMRKFLGVTHAGLFEITEYSLLWMTFLGTAWLLKNDGHIRVDLMLNYLNPRRRAVTNIVASIIGIILLGVFTWYSLKLTLSDYQAGIFHLSYLRPLKWPLEIIIPIGYFLLFVELIRKTYKHLTSWRALSKVQRVPPDSAGAEF